jgi:hypothetical protein
MEKVLQKTRLCESCSLKEKCRTVCDTVMERSKKGFVSYKQEVGIVDIKGHAALLAKALRALYLTRDYVEPTCDLPALPGWEWYDTGKAIAEAIPNSVEAAEFWSRVKIDTETRAIRKDLEEWMIERSCYYNENRARLSFDDFIQESTLETPRYNVNGAFFNELVRNIVPARVEWLTKCNVIRIDDIMSDKEKDELFNNIEESSR